MKEDVGEVCDVVADGAPRPVKRGRKSAAVSEEKEEVEHEGDAKE